MKKKKCVALLLTVLATALLLCGCGYGNNVEELFALPKMPDEYTGLNQLLAEMNEQGYESIAPTTGQHLQSVHMVDLDGDREVEAIAFFRNSQDEKPMKMFVYKQAGGSYEQLCSVESGGSSIDSVHYEDLNGDGQCEVIVGWKMTADVQTLAVYNIGREALPLMSGVYSRYAIEDINEDGLPELFVLRSDSNGAALMEVYMWQTNILAVAHHSVLSTSMSELSRGSIVTGTTAEGRSAVYVTGINEQNNAVTDVLVWQSSVFGDGSVVNAAMSESTGRSTLSQPYRQLTPLDIDGDGITEIPAPARTSTQNDTLVYWQQYSLSGEPFTVSQTYHSQSNGWYFTLPYHWWGDVTVAVEETVAGENQVLLYVDNSPVLSIYTLTGENRENRSTMGERFLIRRQTGVVYAGELLEGADLYGMDASLLRSSFHMIENAWLPGGGW